MPPVVAKLEVNMGNNMLDKEFKDLVLYAKQDILKTRYEVQENANMEFFL